MKFDIINPNLLITGGWDEIIYFWDLRAPKSYANYLTGPLVCSETLDYQDEKLLTGSWRTNQRIEIWDIRRFRKIQELEWNCDNGDTIVQICKFPYSGAKKIIASGTNKAGVNLYEENNGIWQKIECFDLQDEAEYYTGEFAIRNEKEMVLGNNKGEIILLNLQK